MAVRVGLVARRIVMDVLGMVVALAMRVLLMV
jgi:hypothetical protein